MVDTEFHSKALELLRQADEADQNGNEERAAYLTAQAQVFATLQSSVVAFATAEDLLAAFYEKMSGTTDAVDGLTAQVRKELGELNQNLDDIKARTPAT
jgi:hypothetical protein